MKVGEFLTKHNLLPPQLSRDADVLEDKLPTEAEDIIDQFLDTVDESEKEKQRSFLRKHIISQSQTSVEQPPLKKMRIRQSANIHKRVAALETHSKHETHVLDIPINVASLVTAGLNQTNLTNMITVGTLESQRSGNEVRIKSIEITLSPESQPSLDVYLLRPSVATNTPITAHFSGTQGGRYLDSEGWEMKHWLLGGADAQSFYAIDDRMSFKFPMKVRYDGTVTSSNAVYLAITNHTGGTLTNIKGNVRIRFYP